MRWDPLNVLCKGWNLFWIFQEILEKIWNFTKREFWRANDQRKYWDYSLYLLSLVLLSDVSVICSRFCWVIHTILLCIWGRLLPAWYHFSLRSRKFLWLLLLTALACYFMITGQKSLFSATSKLLWQAIIGFWLQSCMKYEIYQEYITRAWSTLLLPY